jgi:sugar phosphate isomerase/epimerase
VRQFRGASLPVFHLNDYPANMPRETSSSADRVYPGDGVAPIVETLRDLRVIGFEGVLSLELFNPQYWQEDALAVARTGLEKMKAVVAGALG